MIQRVDTHRINNSKYRRFLCWQQSMVIETRLDNPACGLLHNIVLASPWRMWKKICRDLFFGAQTGSILNSPSYIYQYMIQDPHCVSPNLKTQSAKKPDKSSTRKEVIRWTSAIFYPPLETRWANSSVLIRYSKTFSWWNWQSFSSPSHFSSPHWPCWF